MGNGYCRDRDTLNAGSGKRVLAWSFYFYIEAMIAFGDWYDGGKAIIEPLLIFVTAFNFVGFIDKMKKVTVMNAQYCNASTTKESGPAR